MYLSVGLSLLPGMVIAWAWGNTAMGQVLVLQQRQKLAAL